MGVFLDYLGLFFWVFLYFAKIQTIICKNVFYWTGTVLYRHGQNSPSPIKNSPVYNSLKNLSKKQKNNPRKTVPKKSKNASIDQIQKYCRN